jgi:hypothetical protein
MHCHCTPGLVGASAALAASSLAGLGNRIWFDHLMPFITYKFVAGDEGRTDLIVGNVMDDLFGGYLGKGQLLSGALTPDGAPAKGVMRIKNFDVIGSTFGSQQSALGAGVNGGEPLGTLNMVFKKANPIAAALGVVGWMLPGGIGIAFQAMALADAALGIAAAASRFAKGLKWAEGSDPLVIDLDGDGIETVSQGVSKAYFDIDGDLFREKTGWLKGDDGFLVLDGNANGRVDDISELFGNRAEGGFAELAGYDLGARGGNGDGLISAGDAIWSALQVWQDKDGDGITGAGELRGLAAAGIVSISLGTTALDVLTPQGTRLLASGSVSFTGGRTSQMSACTVATSAANDDEWATMRVAA